VIDDPVSTTVRVLLDDLALLDQQDGEPAIVLVHDYGEREALVASIQREAKIHGIDLVTFSTPEEAATTLPTLSAPKDQAAALLPRAGTGADWGRWLDSNRDRLPSFCRFLLVLVLASDLPALAMTAPAFMSWAKARVIDRLLVREEEEAPSNIADDLERMRAETGRSPQEFIAAWERGDIDDTYRNNVWLNLARAAVGGE
jgi:pimeloyl-ACP methyl ester carboxylesterase